MKRVLVTGASGFIGRNCIPALMKSGYEIHALSFKSTGNLAENVCWSQVDLLDASQIGPLLKRVKPTHLLHCAWHVNTQDWSVAPDNFLWVQATLELLRQFYDVGGRRVVITGSCMEYDGTFGYCSEFVVPHLPSTFYGQCKNGVRMMMEALSSHLGFDSAWARIFHLYGPHEAPQRLVPSVVCSLLKGEPVQCTDGNQVRDFLYVQDVADACVALLNSEVTGAVNIGSGKPVLLRDLIKKIGELLSREHLIELGAIPRRVNEPNVLLANVERLSREVGWKSQISLECGLQHTIMWWKKQLSS